MSRVSSRGTFVNMEETSREHYSNVMLVLFGARSKTNGVFDSALVGQDWLKYTCSNKVRSKIAVIGLKERAERTASFTNVGKAI